MTVLFLKNNIYDRIEGVFHVWVILSSQGHDWLFKFHTLMSILAA
jgi:hypothetical protein